MKKYAIYTLIIAILAALCAYLYKVLFEEDSQ